MQSVVIFLLKSFKSRKQGIATIAMTLISVLVLGGLTAAAYNAAGSTKRIEIWQTEDIELKRLDLAARSVADAMADALAVRSADFGTAQDFENIISSDTVQIINDPESDTTMSVKLTVEGYAPYEITSKASSSRSNKTRTVKATVTITNGIPDISWENK